MAFRSCVSNAKREREREREKICKSEGNRRKKQSRSWSLNFAKLFFKSERSFWHCHSALNSLIWVRFSIGFIIGFSIGFTTLCVHQLSTRSQRKSGQHWSLTGAILSEVGLRLVSNKHNRTVLSLSLSLSKFSLNKDITQVNGKQKKQAGLLLFLFIQISAMDTHNRIDYWMWFAELSGVALSRLSANGWFWPFVSSSCVMACYWWLYLVAMPCGHTRTALSGQAREEWKSQCELETDRLHSTNLCSFWKQCFQSNDCNVAAICTNWVSEHLLSWLISRSFINKSEGSHSDFSV